MITTSYGEIITVDDLRVDIGGIRDEWLADLRTTLENSLARGGYYARILRTMDEEALEMVLAEQRWRDDNNEHLTENLPGVYYSYADGNGWDND